MSTIDPADFAALQEQVATLRQQVGHLLRFIHFETAEDDETKVTSLSVEAGLVTSKAFILRDEQSRHRGRLVAWDDEASLALFDEDEKPRVVLKASRADTSIEMRDPQGDANAQLFTDQGGQGNIAVFSPGGIPRVLMKGLPEGGSVATLYPDGKPRGILLATDEKNELVFVDAKQRTLARVGAFAAGGLVRLEGAAGDAFASLGVTPHGGSMLLQTAAGHLGVSALAAETGNLVKVEGLGAGQGGEDKTSVTLLGLKDISSISLRNGAGVDLVDLIASATGGNISVKAAAAPASEIVLNVGEESPFIKVNHAEGGSAVLLTSERSSQLSLSDQEDSNNLILSVAEKGGYLAIGEAEQLRLSLGCSDEGQPAITLHNADGSPALQLLRHGNGGGASVYSSDGTRQVAMTGSPEGGQLGLFGDLGIERAILRTIGDGAALSLRWGGTDALQAVASEAGGALIVFDHDGHPTGTLPASDDDSEADA